jgi:hypothetical protein
VDAGTQSLILGFVLTTVLGGLLGAGLQRAQWNRQARLEIAKKNFSDAGELVDAVLDLTDRRYYHLYRWYSSVRDQDPNERVAEREQQYFLHVHEWNESLRSHHQGLRRHLGVAHALSYLNYQDDLDLQHPTSLHYRFVLATKLVRRAASDANAADRAWSEIERLNWHLTEFAQEASTALMHRSQSLGQLRAKDEEDDSPALTSRPQPQHPSRASAT